MIPSSLLFGIFYRYLANFPLMWVKLYSKQALPINLGENIISIAKNTKKIMNHYRKLSIVIISSAISHIAGLWVATMINLLASRRDSKISIINLDVVGSIEAVGSSAKINGGFFKMIFAKATRCD